MQRWLRTLTTLVGLVLFGTCDVARAAKPGEPVDDAGDREVQNLAKYTERCQRDLGFDFPKDLSCYDEYTRELVITATHDGKARKVKTPADLVLENECDNPILLTLPSASKNNLEPDLSDKTSCVPYSRIGVRPPVDSKRKNKKQGEKVELTYICRTNFFREPDKKHRVRFDDLGVIAYNTETGGTCFWAIPINENRPFGNCAGDDLSCDTDAACAKDEGPCDLISDPAEERFADPKRHFPVPGSDKDKGFWKDLKGLAEGTCMRCHDSDPFIHTPVLELLTKTKAVTKVAGPHEEPDIEVPSHPSGNYWAVADKVLHEQGGSDGWTWTFGLALDRSCAKGCHRIGAQETCRTLVADAVGKEKRTTAAEQPDNKNAWMPSRSFNPRGRPQASDFAHIRGCCPKLPQEGGPPTLRKGCTSPIPPRS